MYAGCSSLRDWPGLMAGLAGLSPTRIVRPLITAYLPARPGPGGVSYPGSQATLVAGHRRGRQLCAMLAEVLKKKILLLSSWQCRRVPAEQGTGDSAFCRTPFWVACHVLGCVWVCVDAGFCSAYPYWVLLLHCLWGVWGFLLVPVANLRVTRFRQKTVQIRSISARRVRRRAR